MQEFKKGSKIKIVYDDANRIVTKEGSFESKDESFIYILTDRKEAIAISRIIRLEVQE